MNAYSGENLKKRLLSDMGLEKADINTITKTKRHTFCKAKNLFRDF